MGKPPRHRGSPKKSPNATTIPSPLHAPAQQLKGIPSSNSSTGSAPSSVMCVPASVLTRELSDLSGSYMNGNTAPRSSLNRSFGNSVCSEEPVQGFWRQAHILSAHCPREPAPAAAPASPPTVTGSSSSALIVVERNGVIELVKKSDAGSTSGEEELKETSSQHDKESSQHNESAISAEDDLMFLAHNSQASLLLPTSQQNTMDNANNAESSRIPILILLMDPGRKQYELMQLWVDPQTDLVRDVLHALQHKLSDKWRQDYDGLFQLRGNRYCQLVHILSIAKYDVRPRELFVAKPWSMAAKSTTDLANDCIRQLRAGGLLSNYAASSPGKSRIKNFLRSGRNSPVTDEDGPLTLSDEALKRIYVPDGIMKHHHACQFLSFRVPAIPRVLGHPHTAHNSHNNKGFLGSLLGTSQSFDDVSSQLSNPSEAMLLPVPETPHKLNSSSSAASPSSVRRQRHQQGYSRQHRLPTPINLNSKWQPSGPLEVVGEVYVSSSTGTKDASAHQSDSEEPANVSTILVDLETNNFASELKQQQQQHQQTQQQQYEPPLEELHRSKKEHRCSLRTLFAPLNCSKRRSRAGGSRKGDDCYSSSHGSSSKSKNSKKSSSHNDGNDGRDTPTSKGSGDDGDDANEESFHWNKSSEDHSIVSDSAPLLSTMPADTSSICSSVTGPVPEQPLHQVRPPPPRALVSSASPFSRYYSGR